MNNPLSTNSNDVTQYFDNFNQPTVWSKNAVNTFQADFAMPTFRSEYGEGGFDLYTYFQRHEPPLVCAGPTPSVSSSSLIECDEDTIERTVAVIKPVGMPYKDVILRVIFEAGFQILSMRYVHLTPEQVSEFYSQHYGNPSFPHLVISVSEEPVLALCLSAHNVISKWRNLVGPDGSIKEEWFYPVSVKYRFGLQENISNALHASENSKDSKKENRYLFPKNTIEPLISEEEQVKDYCKSVLNPILLEGITQLVKKKPVDPILFLAEWLLMNNPYQPRMSYKLAMLPT